VPSPVVPGHHRVVARLAAAVAAILALAGCAQVDAALSTQLAVITFRPDATVATLRAVRQSCSHIPNVQPLAVFLMRRSSSSPGNWSVRSGGLVPGHPFARYSLHYQAAKASGRNLAALQACLEHIPGVSGVAFEDVSSGG
jgi:hypothetical protein